MSGGGSGDGNALRYTELVSNMSLFPAPISLLAVRKETVLAVSEKCMWCGVVWGIQTC